MHTGPLGARCTGNRYHSSHRRVPCPQSRGSILLIGRPLCPSQKAEVAKRHQQPGVRGLVGQPLAATTEPGTTNDTPLPQTQEQLKPLSSMEYPPPGEEVPLTEPASWIPSSWSNSFPMGIPRLLSHASSQLRQQAGAGPRPGHHVSSSSSNHRGPLSSEAAEMPSPVTAAPVSSLQEALSALSPPAAASGAPGAVQPASSDHQLLSAFHQLRAQLAPAAWEKLTSDIVAAAAAAAAAQEQRHLEGGGEPGPQPLQPIHGLHDNHPVPLATNNSPRSSSSSSSSSIAFGDDIAELDLGEWLAHGEVHGYGRRSIPDALASYEPGYSPLHLELQQLLWSDEEEEVDGEGEEGSRAAEGGPVPAVRGGRGGPLGSSWSAGALHYGTWWGPVAWGSGNWAEVSNSSSWRTLAARQRLYQQQVARDMMQQLVVVGQTWEEPEGEVELVGRHHITVIPPAASPLSSFIEHEEAEQQGGMETRGVSVQPPGPAEAGAGEAGGAGADDAPLSDLQQLNSRTRSSFPQYEHLVFGGGGARCLAYAGALHSLRQLGLVGRLKAVSGASGGAVYALLAALGLSVQEVLAAMTTLPEHEPMSLLRFNSRLGLTDGEATFSAIQQAISSRLGIEEPTLGDVAAATGVRITLAATSLSRRAPVYLSSDTSPDMRVIDALRGSCAIPFIFSPVKGPEGDLLVDGCITDCTPLRGLAAGVDPSRVLVLAVHDAAGLEGADVAGLLSGLVATCMQAGYHHTATAGVDVLNLWSSVAGVNPLQFRLGLEHARDVVAASQAMAEGFAVARMRKHEAEQQAAEAAAQGAASMVPGTSAGPAGPQVGGTAPSTLRVGGGGPGGRHQVVAPVTVTGAVSEGEEDAGQSWRSRSRVAAGAAVGSDAGSCLKVGDSPSPPSGARLLPEGCGVGGADSGADCAPDSSRRQSCSDVGVDCWWHTWDESMLTA